MRSLFLFFSFVPFLLIGQQTDQYIIAAQGDFSESNEMSLSWTIGDLLTETAFFEDQNFTQGFQQPFLKMQENLLPSREEPEEIESSLNEDLKFSSNGSYEVNVFPNPADGIFNVEILNDEKLFFLEVLDASGRSVYQTQRDCSFNVLDLSTYENGLYMLRISNSELKKSSSIKLIKN